MPKLSNPDSLALYTDNSRFCCKWLDNLIHAGELPVGVTWCGNIEWIKELDASRYKAIHWFAGIGGWPLALQLAGWPEGRRVWTGSCPCQPFSSAGKRRGFDDERHLWPEWLRLIAQHRPPTIFGEQVASNLGRQWLTGVRVDLEALGYAVGAVDLCAAGVGSPQIRQRLYWVADRSSGGSGTAQPRNGEAEVEGRREDEIPPHRRFVDSFGNNYRIPEPPVPFVVDGFPDILDRIRAYGNAIVPQVGAAFVRAFLEAEAAVERQDTGMT